MCEPTADLDETQAQVAAAEWGKVMAKPPIRKFPEDPDHVVDPDDRVEHHERWEGRQ